MLHQYSMRVRRTYTLGKSMATTSSWFKRMRLWPPGSSLYLGHNKQASPLTDMRGRSARLHVKQRPQRVGGFSRLALASACAALATAAAFLAVSLASAFAAFTAAAAALAAARASALACALAAFSSRRFCVPPVIALEVVRAALRGRGARRRFPAVPLGRCKDPMRQRGRGKVPRRQRGTAAAEPGCSGEAEAQACPQGVGVSNAAGKGGSPGDPGPRVSGEGPAVERRIACGVRTDRGDPCPRASEARAGELLGHGSGERRSQGDAGPRASEDCAATGNPNARGCEAEERGGVVRSTAARGGGES